MNKVLYVSNIEVPYRSEFFNQLSEKVDLTVLYERKKSSNRDESWSKSTKSKYKIKYLNGFKIKNEYSIDLQIIKHVFSKKYDTVIMGCYNSPSQMLAILCMRLLKKKYILNIDGEYFLEGNSIKQRIKRFLIKGADKYLIAGEQSAKNLSKIISQNKIFTYYFSSLTKKELEKNATKQNKNINNSVIVIGQYYDYKGLDMALQVAKLDQNLKYKFIGSGKRSSLLEEKVKEMNLNNVEVIPFLQKKQLYKEYQNCLCMFLPTKQECWGLVVNEASSFGCPIISTYGSGAAVEFLKEKYRNYLSNYNDIEGIYTNIKEILENLKTKKYKEYLINCSKKYSIEIMVEKTLNCIKTGGKNED